MNRIWLSTRLTLEPCCIPDPIRLSLSRSFRTLMFQLVDQTTREKEAGVFGALPKVALVVSQSHQISEMDFESAQRILHGSMKQFPDLFFVFLSSDVNTFRDMVGDSRERTASERLVRVFSYTDRISVISLIGFAPFSGHRNIRAIPFRRSQFHSHPKFQELTRRDLRPNPEADRFAFLQVIRRAARVG